MPVLKQMLMLMPIATATVTATAKRPAGPPILWPPSRWWCSPPSTRDRPRYPSHLYVCGTTNDNADIWFAGFTPDLVAVNWFGFDRPKRIVANATGGGYGAPVWGQFMRSMYYGEAKEFEVMP